MPKTIQKILYYNSYQALAYSDVYLYPAYSDIKSRFGTQIDITTKVALGAPKLKIPFTSSGMDTVTEDEMATIMALNGGIGEIHRNNLPDEQAELVRIVKEHMRLLEKNPPMVSDKATITDALCVIEKRKRGYLIVYPGNKFDGTFSGMATSRDFISASSDTPLKKVMTPLKPQRDGRVLFTVKKGTSLIEAVKIMRQKRVEKIPVVDSKLKLVGVYTLKDFQHIKEYPKAALDNQGRLVVGAAIGVHKIDIERALKLEEAGVDILFLDIAHGHSIHSKEMLKKIKIKEKIKIPIIVGNFATKEGVLFAYEIGADGIKVGIGPGYSCRTRNIAGTGIPQITAILEAKKALQNKTKPPPIIADGGIREPGDVAKAIACGADCVMSGSIFVGTDKSPGELVKIKGILQKRYRGMSSKDVYESRAKMGDSTTDPSLYTPEGRDIFTPYQGTTQDLIKNYVGGLKSAMSYAGAHTIKELQSSKLIHISSSGYGEQFRIQE